MLDLRHPEGASRVYHRQDFADFFRVPGGDRAVHDAGSRHPLPRGFRRHGLAGFGRRQDLRSARHRHDGYRRHHLFPLGERETLGFFS